MPVVIAALWLCLWMAIAWRQFERGDPLLAGVCALVGILLAIFRLNLWRTRRSAKNDERSPLS